jgi:molecular chaperone GrpE (heat shock protein)
MLNWLKQLWQKPQTDDEQRLILERELQNLRLELTERDRKLANLKQELERQRSSENTRINAAIQREIEQLLSDIASPVSQLLTQGHLLEVEGKPVQAKDILTVAKRLICTLEDRGLSINGKISETLPFEPNYHQPLSSNLDLAVGTPVVIKIVGVSYQGKMIKKATVEPPLP